MSVRSPRHRAVALLLFLTAISSRCLAVYQSGKMSWWELLWWEGSSDYPPQWWHGLAPRLPYVIVVAVVAGGMLLLVSRSVRYLLSRWQQGSGESGP